MTLPLAPDLQLPWSTSSGDDRRFNRLLGASLLLLLFAIIGVSLVDVPDIPRAERERLPPQLARVVLEQQELPPPQTIEPPRVEEKPPEPVPPEPAEPTPEQPRPAEPQPRPVDAQPAPATPRTTVEQARETAAQSGLLQHRDELMAMRDLVDTGALENRSLQQGGTQAATTERAMPTSGLTTTSGGINPGQLSRDTGTGGLAGRQTTQVTSELATATQGASGPAGGGGSGSDAGRARSEEEMSRIMDQHKGAVFQIYNRALRQNATLQGRVVMNIIIEPSGQVSDVSIITSELRDAELEAALIRRIRMITFPANTGVIRTTLRQTFDFLPQ